jgi:hypothetical protein
MSRELQDAISGLVTKSQADRRVLRVAEAATRIAREHGGDSREIAILITRAGIAARLNMEISTPSDAFGAAVASRWFR